MAPISNSLMYDYPGMGGFIYKDLISSAEGKMINWFNGQFYFQYTEDTYSQCVDNGYNPNKIVFGMIGTNDNSFDNELVQIKKVSTKYPNFAGVYIWELCNSPPDPKNPYLWSKIIYKNIKQLKDKEPLLNKNK